MTGHSQAKAQPPDFSTQTRYGKNPKPQNEDFIVNGRTVSQRHYGTNGWQSQVNLPDYQNQSLQTAGQGINNLLPSIRQNIFTTPQEQQQFTNSLYAPQKANLMNEYSNLLGNANQQATSQGTGHSAGFENFRAKQLDRNLTQNLSDLYNQSYLQSFQLPSLKLAPIQQAMNMYQGTQDDINNQVLNQLNPAFQGSQAGTDWANTRYNAEQQQLMNQFNAQNIARQPTQTGFMGSLFG